MRGCHAGRTGIGRSSQPGLQECGGGHFRAFGGGRRGTRKAVADAIELQESVGRAEGGKRCSEST